MDGNGRKWLRMDGYGYECFDMDGNYFFWWKGLKINGNCKKCLDIVKKECNS